jgi:methionyl aminopeptidase
MEELDLNILLEIGKFTQKIRREVKDLIKKNTPISKIVEFVEESIFKQGYTPAFPCTVCINEVAAHYTYYDEDYYLQKGDLVKIDFGINYKGNLTDNAFTIEIETNNYETLLNANKKALNKVLENIAQGKTLNEIGQIVEDIAKKNNFNSIHNLSGHEIGINNLHYGLHIPNYANSSKKKIQPNTLLAIEPFLTTGAPLVKSTGSSNILHLTNDKPIRDPIAKKILMHIKENYPKLPFSKRWLLKKFDKKKVNYAIRVLKSQNIIHEYEILSSKDNSFISQFEETIYIREDKNIIITRQEK